LSHRRAHTAGVQKMDIYCQQKTVNAPGGALNPARGGWQLQNGISIYT